MSKFKGLALETERPFRVFLLSPADGQPIRDGQGNKAWVDVLSADSRKANELRRTVIDKRLSGEKATAETIDANGNANLASLVTGWYLIGSNRDPIDLPFSYENALEMFSDPSCDWIKEQVARGSELRRNFMPAPPPPSETSPAAQPVNPSSEPTTEAPGSS